MRSVQDWYVRYALLGAEGVSEVASVGGFVREYQIDVDPDAMRAFGVGLEEIVKAVKASNVDVGARTIEINKVEYVVRGIGFVKHVSDIEKTVIKVNDNVPIYIKDIAKVAEGSALRRGALDKGGAEAVGGVVVVRYGYNPLEAIKNVKAKIEEIAPGLREKILPDGTVSKVTIVPFYDRTGLIYETLGTLDTALTEEVLVTIIGVIGFYHLAHDRLPRRTRHLGPLLANVLAVVVVGMVLTQHWLPLGPVQGLVRNLVFVALLIGSLLLLFKLFQHSCPSIPGWCLEHKVAFLSLPALLLVVGAVA